MPRLTVWFIRSSMVYLIAGITIGALILSNKGVPFEPSVWKLLPVHIEFVIQGWILQLAMGVAYWMFPRFTPERTGMKIRGYERFAWAALFILNGGIIIYVLGATLRLGLMLQLIGRTLELVGIIAFAINLWPRVKPVSQV